MGAGILFAQAKPLSKVDFQIFLLIPENPWKLFYMKKNYWVPIFSSLESVLVMVMCWDIHDRQMPSGFLSIFSCLTVSLSPRTMKLHLQHPNR
jgi:hypothetical protein